MSFRVFHSLEEARDVAGPAAVTIGNFDGVHRGHQMLFAQVEDAGRVNGWASTALTFAPHPARILKPEKAPRLLSTLEQRLGWMREAGLDQAVVLPFTRELSELAPEEFVRQILIEALDTRLVVVGDNFRFGRRAAGDIGTLQEMGRQFGFKTSIVCGLTVRGVAVSSSEIRALIEAGRVARAGRLLGRPYGLSGEVVAGHGIGRTQTVPTLNLKTAAEILPAAGVYVTSVSDLESGLRWASVTNIGFRPTFGGQEFSIESFVLSSFAEPAPARIRVEFHHRLREERAFPDAGALKAQILRDVARAQAWHRRAGAWTNRPAKASFIAS
ncbi:MAG: bifunctional riboflavin kinase/FAD synthetase [Acidobacteriota bacterium]